MSIPSDQVDTFRTLRADRYVDTVDIVRLGSRGAINETTLVYDSESDTPVASGQSALIRPAATSEPAVTEFGQEGVQRTDYIVYFPHDAALLQVDDQITVTASEKSPNLVGKVLTVTGVFLDSYATKMWVTADLDLGSGEE